MKTEFIKSHMHDELKINIYMRCSLANIQTKLWKKTNAPSVAVSLFVTSGDASILVKGEERASRTSEKIIAKAKERVVEIISTAYVPSKHLFE